MNTNPANRVWATQARDSGTDGRARANDLGVRRNGWRAAAAVFGAFAAVALSTAPRKALAQSGPPRIPDEAFAACESKVEGDACTVQLRERELKGTCVKEPSGSRLACRPDDMPPPPR
jgi:hypothetical protein